MNHDTIERRTDIKTFNTGRLYAAIGQPITYAVYRWNNRSYAVFVDDARGIDGAIPLHHGNLDLITDSWILRAYDDYHYQHVYDLTQRLRDDRRTVNPTPALFTGRSTKSTW